MSGLRDFVVPTEQIPLDKAGKQSFGVRGLAFEDLSQLAIVHGPVMTSVFLEGYGAAITNTLTAEKVAHMIQDALTNAPGLVTDIICLAADEPELQDVVKKIPPVFQVQAIEKIVELTIVSEGELKKLVEIITRGMTGATGLVKDLSTASTNGSGPSAAK